MARKKPQSLANRLRELRHAAGLSQDGLAKAGDLPVRTIRQLEGGRRTDPHLSTLVALADGLGVTLDELAGRAWPEQL